MCSGINLNIIIENQDKFKNSIMNYREFMNSSYPDGADTTNVDSLLNDCETLLDEYNTELTNYIENTLDFTWENQKQK